MAFDLLRVVERREDARRELGWASAIDELEHAVQVDPVDTGQPLSEVERKAGADQLPGAPPHPLRTIVHTSAVDAHARVRARKVLILT
jgi:hypothetical protein